MIYKVVHIVLEYLQINFFSDKLRPRRTAHRTILFNIYHLAYLLTRSEIACFVAREASFLTLHM